MAVELHRRMERQITRHVAAGIKVLVKPFVRRRDHAALVPRTNDLFFALFPHDRIAFTGRDNDRPARAMAMRLLIGFGREHRHVRRQLGIRELHEHALAAGAAALIGIELVPGAHIGEKVAVPKSAHAQPFVRILCLHHLRFRIEVAVRYANFRFVRVIEIHVGLRQRRHGHRHIAVMKQPDRLIALHVAEHVPVIARHQKHRVLLPLEVLFRLALVRPNCRETAAGQYIDDFVEGKFYRRQ